MKTYDWLVVGGGFQGVIATSILAEKEKSIAILDRADGLGGVLRGKEHNNLILDFGCHVFNNDKSDVTAIMRGIMKDAHHPIFIEYAAVTEGHKREELAIPDFTFWPKEKQIGAFYEALCNAIKREKGCNDFDNLQEWMNNGFGEEAGKIVGKIMEKASNYKASDLDQSAVYRTPLACVHLIDDDEMVLKLKQTFPELDKVMALPSQKDEMRFYREAQKDFEYRTFYPSNNGMRGFGECAEKYLSERDVDFLLGRSIKSVKNAPTSGVIVTLDNDEEIQVGNLVWTLDVGFLSSLLFQENPLENHALKVPMTLFYYFVDYDEKPAYDYIHDFRSDTTAYRMSAPGFYGKQVNDKNQSYYCVEVPSSTDSDVWKNSEKYYDKVWEQMIQVGLVKKGKPQESFHLNSPMSYPMMRKGYKPFYNQIVSRVEKEFPAVVNVNMNAYTKNEMVEVIRSKMQDINIAA